MNKVIEITQEQFDEKVNSGNNVLVDCYAEWCGPCKMLSPIIDELAEENNSYLFYKLNIDEAQEIAVKYEIMSIPTLLVFENGELKNTVIGLHSKAELEEILN